MLLSNTEMIPGFRTVRHIGLVQGNTIRAKNIGRDILAGFKNIVGGELKGRKEATERMIQQAQTAGANAIVNIRFATSSITQGAAELFAYGTAVTVEQETQA